MNAITRKKLYTAIYCALGTAALGAMWTSAQAADESPPSKTVKFADLNIQTPEGAKVLYHRIRVAASQVCGDGDPIMRDAVRVCTDTAIDNAVKKVNAPYLTALRFGNKPNVQLASK
jgi:UrcA family protein